MTESPANRAPSVEAYRDEICHLAQGIHTEKNLRRVYLITQHVWQIENPPSQGR